MHGVGWVASNGGCAGQGETERRVGQGETERRVGQGETGRRVGQGETGRRVELDRDEAWTETGRIGST